MNVRDVIDQAKSRAGADPVRKRGTEAFEQESKRWMEVESPERVLNRMAAAGMERDIVEVAAAIMEGTPSEAFNPFERILNGSQLMSSIFLPLGAERMRAVGRIITATGVGFGTGFLISPRLLLTNNHVLEDATMAAQCRVQFDFVRRADGQIGVTEVYRLVPSTFFLTADVTGNPNLDYTIVAVEETNEQGAVLARRGCIPLIAASGKLIRKDLTNIIQHPGGEPQQIALRDSQVTEALDHFIRYEADTLPGSSGSPVFNDLWQLGALHHSGVPEEVSPGVYRLIDGGTWDTRQRLSREQELQLAAKVKWISNEGVRISSIVADVQRRLAGDAARMALFEEAVREHATPPVTPPPPPVPPRESTAGGGTATMTMDGGTMTWTVPLRVTVQLGPEIEMRLSAAAPVPSAAPPSAPAPPSPAAPQATREDAHQAASRARESLAGRADVLEVRSGFLWRDGVMTDERAVVVVLDPTAPSGGGGIPASIDGVPVDVTVGGVTALLRAAEARGTIVAERIPIADLFTEGIPAITYVPPQGVALDEVTQAMEVTCHASPDDGWAVLEQFLDRTKKTLTLGIFDCTAPHAIAKFRELAEKPGFRFNLAIQRGHAGGLSGKKKDDEPEDQWIPELSQTLGSRFVFGFVDVGGEDQTFASSYHIKVAVRDSREVWLSSGNIQTSNLPDIEPAATNETRIAPLRDFNREWHVVIENAALARTFEAFLLHDLDTARKNPAEEPKPKDEVLVPAEWLQPPALAAFEAQKKAKYFPRRRFPKSTADPVRVQPLLTPDNYIAHAIPFVREAKKTLFVQNQSLKILDEGKNDERFLDLFRAILDRHHAGVDVRMIFRVHDRDEDGARAIKDRLVDFGFPRKTIRVQAGCHTKGVIVDSKAVIVGSHNWTNEGALVNRDASLLFRHPDIAGYFEQIFLFDWDTLSREPRPPKPKPPGAESAAPQAFVRVAVEDLLED